MLRDWSFLQVFTKQTVAFRNHAVSVGIAECVYRFVCCFHQKPADSLKRSQPDFFRIRRKVVMLDHRREEWFAESTRRIVKIATGRRRGLGDDDEGNAFRCEPAPKGEVLVPLSSQHRRATKTGLHHWPPEKDGQNRWLLLLSHSLSVRFSLQNGRIGRQKALARVRSFET